MRGDGKTHGAGAVSRLVEIAWVSGAADAKRGKFTDRGRGLLTGVAIGDRDFSAGLRQGESDRLTDAFSTSRNQCDPAGERLRELHRRYRKSCGGGGV